MGTDAPNVLLRGGPDHLPHSERIRCVDDPMERIKLPVGNGYEHFTPSGEIVESESGRLHVYVWSYRTSIAE